MNYTDARKYIKNLTSRGIVPGLTSITKLCDKLGNPQNALDIIHIAGTNGKGSTGAFLESILIHAGYNVFRFVSPAVNDYLEMYTYNREIINENDYAECVAEISKIELSLNKDGIYPTSFEAETAIAFLLAKKYKPDYVLIECGMGGRLDSTNVAERPVLSVITSVSLDHTAFLGDKIEDIAYEKCGIIKEHVPVVTTQQTDSVLSIIKTTCKDKQAPLYVAEKAYDIVFLSDRTTFKNDIGECEIFLNGTYQPQNAMLAIKASQVLNIDNGSIIAGLKDTKWQYRFERIGKFILDGAHNIDAALKLAESADIYLSGQKTAFICGIFKDKDYESIAQITAPFAQTVYTVTPPGERGLDSSVLADTFQKYHSDVIDAKKMHIAIGECLNNNYDNILIFGSLSILSEAKEIILSLLNERDI